MAAEAAPTGADHDMDPSRVIARALRPYADRVRLARVVILVAYLANIAALYLVGDPSTWVVLGITAVAVIAATRGVQFLLPREVRAILPRLRQVRARQDRWLRRMVGLDWKTDPAVVLSSTGGARSGPPDGDRPFRDRRHRSAAARTRDRGPICAAGGR